MCVQADTHRCAMAWVSEANSVKSVFSPHHQVLGIKLRLSKDCRQASLPPELTFLVGPKCISEEPTLSFCFSCFLKQSQMWSRLCFTVLHSRFANFTVYFYPITLSCSWENIYFAYCCFCFKYFPLCVQFKVFCGGCSSDSISLRTPRIANELTMLPRLILNS